MKTTLKKNSVVTGIEPTTSGLLDQCSRSDNHAPLVEVSLMMVFNRNRSQVFTYKCGPSAMSSSPRSCSSSRYHEVNKKAVSIGQKTYFLGYKYTNEIHSKFKNVRKPKNVNVLLILIRFVSRFYNFL